MSLQIPSSDSELNISGRGSFRRFDKTDHDYLLLRQGSVSSVSSQSRQSGGGIPPQPLRPAPIPPYVLGSLQSQGSLDSVFATAPSSPSQIYQACSQSQGSTIPLTQGNAISSGNPRNPQGDGCGVGGSGGGGGSLSNNNPFLPLIQASTQFLSQKFQSFQPHQNGSGTNNDYSKNGSLSESTLSQSPQHGSQRSASNSQYGKPSYHSTTTDESESSVASSSARNSFTSTSTVPNSAGLSMGEILFSSPPAYFLPAASEEPNPVVPDAQTHPFPFPNKKEEKLMYLPSDTKQKNALERSKEGIAEVSRTEGNAGTVNSFSSSDQNENNGTKVVEELQERSHKPSADGSKNLTSDASNSTTGSIGESNNSGSGITTYKPVEHHPTSTSPSPTRLRDRQRKMEFTLQHLQNNQEDRFSSKKHHYNADAVYPSMPSSSANVAKQIGACGGETGSSAIGGSDAALGGNNGISRFRSPKNSSHHHHHHHPPAVPTLTEEVEEQAGAETMNSSSSVSLTETTTSVDKTTMSEVRQKEKFEELRSKSILESMREEIRLENERMADATKSLMMEENFSVEKGRYTTSNGPNTAATATSSQFSFSSGSRSFEKQNSEESRRVQNGKFQRVPSADDRSVSRDEKKIAQFTRPNYSATKGDANSNFTLSSNLNRPSKAAERPVGFNNENSFEGHCSAQTTFGMKPDGAANSGPFGGGPTSSRPVAIPFKNTRSFSLRQSSTDSVGSEGSDVGSPDGSSSPSLQRAMSCDSVCSDTSVILGDLDPPHVTGHLCVGLEYDRYVRHFLHPLPLLLLYFTR
jgi:hypothetical protein